MPTQTRTEMYRDFLLELGYRPHVDDDGDIAFKSEGDQYYIVFSEHDEEFVVLARYRFWEVVEEEVTRTAVMDAAIQVASDIKVAKIIVGEDDDPSVMMEMFCPDPGMFPPIFERALDTLNDAVSAFRKQMGD